jgi:hypothetical protein
VTPDGVDALRASGGYNDVPGWLGPGAWLAYCITTYTALTRALCALRAEERCTVETDAADDADDVWDPDMSTSALFFAWVALLANSRSREQADADASLLVLAAAGGAVVAGFCVGQLGSVLWLACSGLWYAAMCRFRRAAPGAPAAGSMSVLFVLNLLMGTRALPVTDSRGRAPFLLSVDVDFGGHRPAGAWLGPWLMFPTRIMSIFALFFALNLRGNPLWRGTSRSLLRL